MMCYDVMMVLIILTLVNINLQPGKYSISNKF